MLTFANGTSELQQCLNLTIIDDNLVEQNEFFSLIASPSAGPPTSLILFIANDDSKHNIIATICMQSCPHAIGPGPWVLFRALPCCVLKASYFSD